MRSTVKVASARRPGTLLATIASPVPLIGPLGGAFVGGGLVVGYQALKAYIGSIVW